MIYPGNANLRVWKTVEIKEHENHDYGLGLVFFLTGYFSADFH